MNRYAVPLPFSLRINKKTLVLFTVALLLIFIAGFRPIGLDRDSPNYVSLLNIPFSQANFLDKEPAFWMLVEINRVLFSSNELNVGKSVETRLKGIIHIRVIAS